MRTQIKRKKQAKKREKQIRFLKRLSVFLISFFFIIGLTIVDEAYSDMTGREAMLSINSYRLDNEQICLSYLGKSVTVNVAKIEGRITEIKEVMAYAMNGVSESFKESLVIKREPVNELPVSPKTL